MTSNRWRAVDPVDAEVAVEGEHAPQPARLSQGDKGGVREIHG